MENKQITIDGSSGEGGGQILRLSVALCSILKKDLHIHSIRNNRSTPGLRKQHLHCLKSVNQICPTFKIEDVSVGSTEIFCTNIKNQNNINDVLVNTNGASSIALLIQIMLPCIIFNKNKKCRITIVGATDAAFSPPMNFISKILFPILKNKFNIDTRLEIERRGFFPKGGGLVCIESFYQSENINSVDMSDLGEPVKMCASVTIGWSELTKKERKNGKGVKEESCNFYSCLLKDKLNDKLLKHLNFSLPLEVVQDNSFIHNVGINTQCPKNEIKYSKTPASITIQLYLETSTRCLLSANYQTSKYDFDYVLDKTINKLFNNISCGSCVDEHLADQLVIFLALSNGDSCVSIPPVTMFTSKHFDTCINVCKQIIPEFSYNIEPFRHKLQNNMGELIRYSRKFLKKEIGDHEVDCRILTIRNLKKNNIII